ncbi:MAG: PQQ-binding-like beta-propeller repeat protein, partial [Chloroflexi bacterium]|nr:PQQ-binding-like beta-propeller repeat protein [Chloroflexota bacterium]
LHFPGSATTKLTLQDRYEIERRLGAGGMSVVYLARDLRFGAVERWCAVKEMANKAPDLQARRMNLENFEREANILASLSHPAVPRVYDFFSQDSRSYLVMEFIDGTDLEKIWARANGPLDANDVVNWALQLCDVLSYLHSHQPPVVFRDVKPSNIMLTHQQPRIMLIDFGIARIFQTGTRGTMIGTEGYAPPEQYRGVAEPRGDIYALGASLHHLLSGRDPRLEAPFTFQERPIRASNPRVPPALEEAINKALHYELDQRYATAQEMGQALARAFKIDGRSDVSAPARPGAVTAATGGRDGAESSSVATGQIDQAMASPSSVKPVWQFKCEDEVRSSPRILGTTLFIGSYDHNLYALDARTGKFIWKYATEGGISSTPYLTPTAIYIGSEDSSLYALDPKGGKVIWQFRTKGPIRSSPRVAGDLIIVGSDDGAVYAVTLSQGTQVWRFPTLQSVRATPLIVGDMVAVGSDDGHVYALNLKDGRQRWKYNAGRFVMSTASYDDGLVVVGAGDWAVHAINARSGWSVWRVRTGGPVVSSPAVVEGRVYVGSADNCAYALDVHTGRVIWKQAIGSQIASSPAVSGDAVFLGSEDGTVHALDARSGKPRWSYKTGGVITSSPLAQDGRVYIGSTDHHVYAFSVT